MSLGARDDAGNDMALRWADLQQARFAVQRSSVGGLQSRNFGLSRSKNSLEDSFFPSVFGFFSGFIRLLFKSD